jgi:hypothetical protein
MRSEGHAVAEVKDSDVLQQCGFLETGNGLRGFVIMGDVI